MPPGRARQCLTEANGAFSEEPPTFMSALVTEHFSLQSISSATISKSGSRASLYLSALSSGLVAIGFASSPRQDLEALAFSVLPTVFVLGWFTIVRLIDTSVQNLVGRRRIETIRQYYATIDPLPRQAVRARRGAVWRPWRALRRSIRFFTMASMILLVDSVVAGQLWRLSSHLGPGYQLAAPSPSGWSPPSPRWRWACFTSRGGWPRLSHERHRQNFHAAVMVV